MAFLAIVRPCNPGYPVADFSNMAVSNYMTGYFEGATDSSAALRHAARGSWGVPAGDVGDIRLTAQADIPLFDT